MALMRWRTVARNKRVLRTTTTLIRKQKVERNFVVRDAHQMLLANATVHAKLG